MLISAKIFCRKGVTVKQRFASVNRCSKKQPNFGRGGCFLLSFINSAYLSLYFPYVSPPLVLEILKMYSFWQKANRYPFW